MKRLLAAAVGLIIIAGIAVWNVNTDVRLHEVISAFEQQGIPDTHKRINEMVRMGHPLYDLNGHQPYEIHMEDSQQKIFIYTYETDEGPVKASEEVKEKADQLTSIHYKTYRVKNIFIVYVFNQKDDPKRIDEAITNIINQLR